MFTKRLSGCVSLVLLIIGSQTTGVLMADDACYNTTQICFEPYIQSGEIPSDVMPKDIVTNFVLTGTACAASFELVQCTIQTMANCTDDFAKAQWDDVYVVDVEDIMAELICETMADGACKDNYSQCEHYIPPEVSYEYPSAGYTFHIEVDLIDDICRELCLAEISTFCPYLSILYARVQMETMYMQVSNTELLLVDFMNHTCPIIQDADLQCAINQVSVTQFTECIDLALQDHPQIVLYLNMVYIPTPEELRLNCRVLEDMNHCIDTSVGEGCNEVTAQVLKDGLFILGFQFNMSTCEPESGPSRNGAIYLSTDTRTLASAAFMLTLSIHALM